MVHHFAKVECTAINTHNRSYIQFIDLIIGISNKDAPMRGLNEQGDILASQGNPPWMGQISMYVLHVCSNSVCVFCMYVPNLCVCSICMLLGFPRFQPPGHLVFWPNRIPGL